MHEGFHVSREGSYLIHEVPTLVSQGFTLVHEVQTFVDEGLTLVNDVQTLAHEGQNLIDEVSTLVNEGKTFARDVKTLVNEVSTFVERFWASPDGVKKERMPAKTSLKRKCSAGHVPVYHSIRCTFRGAPLKRADRPAQGRAQRCRGKDIKRYGL